MKFLIPEKRTFRQFLRAFPRTYWHLLKTDRPFLLMWLSSVGHSALTFTHGPAVSYFICLAGVLFAAVVIIRSTLRTLRAQHRRFLEGLKQLDFVLAEAERINEQYQNTAAWDTERKAALYQQLKTLRRRLQREAGLMFSTKP